MSLSIFYILQNRRWRPTTVTYFQACCNGMPNGKAKEIPCNLLSARGVNCCPTDWASIHFLTDPEVTKLGLCGSNVHRFDLSTSINSLGKNMSPIHSIAV